MLFPPGAPSRVPIVAITGTNGKTTTARMLAHIMKTAGKQVGLTTTDGIYIDGTQIMAGDMSGPTSAQMVLKNPAVNFAVLETARGGILRSGLGFDRCDIAIVTNIASDHLGLKGVDTLADLARVKSVVPTSVFRDGKSVLNADNEWTADMAKSARGEIIYFSMNEENPVIREHLRNRGRVVVLRPTSQGEMITIIEHRRDTSLLLASQIPATFDGRNRVNIANAMAAAAAALGADVQLEHIRHALRTFTTSYFQTPGRFNLMEIAGRRVLMDYCHNVAGLEAVGDFVTRLDSSRRIGVIAMPGDRQNEDIAAFGKLAAKLFNELIIREDTNTRGRERGEVAGLLRAAAMEGGLDESKITMVLDEVEAVREAIQRTGKDEFVVMLIDKPAIIWEELNNLNGVLTVI
jgi:cyanophycin synthetase